MSEDDRTTPEQRFYLAHFRGRTVVVADPVGSPAAAGCLALLAGEGVRIVHVLAADVDRDPQQSATALEVAADGQVSDWQMVEVWQAITTGGPTDVVVSMPGERSDPLPSVHATAATLARRLRAHKLVLLDAGAPSVADGRARSFATVQTGTGTTAASGLIGAVLADGVEGVNVCRPQDLAAELLTYQGAGTLYTADAYATVRRLGIDDYEQVHRLIELGVAEGYLKPRTEDEIARLVVNGYGAFVGESHLAGLAALLTEPYTSEATGEICALSTISRFAGEGVGRQLVDGIIEAATRAGLRSVFACTVAPEAAAFFRALGFVEVGGEAIPAAKWDSYDPDRRDAVIALRRAC